MLGVFLGVLYGNRTKLDLPKPLIMLLKVLLGSIVAVPPIFIMVRIIPNHAQLTFSRVSRLAAACLLTSERLLDPTTSVAILPAPFPAIVLNPLSAHAGTEAVRFLPGRRGKQHSASMDARLLTLLPAV